MIRKTIVIIIIVTKVFHNQKCAQKIDFSSILKPLLYQKIKFEAPIASQFKYIYTL